MEVSDTVSLLRSSPEFRIEHGRTILEIKLAKIDLVGVGKEAVKT